MSLRELIYKNKAEIWSDPDTADDLETLGIMVSKHCEWVGDDIVKTFLAALHDSNFHELAEKIEGVTNEYFEEME